VTLRLKAVVGKPEDMVVATQRHGKYVSTAKNTHVTPEELLDGVFSMRSMYQILHM
jgi:hypothetical protein